jgi:hypothetical protein
VKPIARRNVVPPAGFSIPDAKAEAQKVSTIDIRPNCITDRAFEEPDVTLRPTRDMPSIEKYDGIIGFPFAILRRWLSECYRQNTHKKS